MLFRASEFDFKAEAFHQKCDNQEDTIVLIRTELGKTIGGYTRYPWRADGGWVNDNSRRTFIFSLDMREKFAPQESERLIYNSIDCGPIFGGVPLNGWFMYGIGCDIFIFDGCNKNYLSRSNFPMTYNRAGGGKLGKNEDNYRLFSGE